MKKLLFSLFLFASSISSSHASEGFLRENAEVYDEIYYEQALTENDFCGVHYTNPDECRSNHACSWCSVNDKLYDDIGISSICANVLDVHSLPSDVFSCDKKIINVGIELVANDIEHKLLNHPNWYDFLNFIETYNKRYESDNDFVHRFSVFVENLNKIENHDFEFELKINQFTDMTEQEFKEYISSGYSNHHDKFRTRKQTCKEFLPNSTAVPASIDWRTKGAVTPVKDQGRCGSCWSFSASGAMEGAWKIAKGNLVSLSEQQLVDCSSLYGNSDCQGGLMDDAFSYAIDEGMCEEKSDPYLAKKTTCAKCTPVAFFSGCVDVPPNNEAALKDAVRRGPVSVAIEADTSVFQFYHSGIITSTKCGTNLDHGVLLVAYGSDNGVDYWTIKNSWGPTWGEGGYVRVAANFASTNDPGICGIAMQPSYPLV